MGVDVSVEPIPGSRDYRGCVYGLAGSRGPGPELLGEVISRDLIIALPIVCGGALDPTCPSDRRCRSGLLR